MTKEAKILIGIAIVVIAGGALLFFTGNPTPEQAGQSIDSQSLIRETSQMTGNTDAKVTLVEFGDFQCPACGYAYPIVKRVLDDYKDNSEVNFVFRQFPLISIHKNAMLAAQASEAAGQQGKFWEMYDTLYSKQTDWSESSDARSIFIQYARDLGLDVDKFTTALDQQTYKEVVQTDIDDGDKLGVNSTPTFYFNGKKLDSTPSYDDLKQMIDEALK